MHTAPLGHPAYSLPLASTEPSAACAVPPVAIALAERTAVANAYPVAFRSRFLIMVDHSCVSKGAGPPTRARVEARSSGRNHGAGHRFHAAFTGLAQAHPVSPHDGRRAAA